MAAKKPTVTRVRIAREELDKMTKEDLQKCWNLQDQYIDLLEGKLNSNTEHTELMSLRESEEKLKQQQIDANRRENILVMRLTTKEHEVQEFAGQIQELKQAQIPTIAQLRSALLDPAVNLLFDKMRKEMDSLKARLEETQNELNAWKFTPDSNTGKRLMAKCRLLYQENEELGKIISSGRMAKLEGDLALQKSFSEEMKKSQSELDEFLLELDEDVEGMQSTIYYLQQQLREAKEQISRLQKEKTGQAENSNPSPVNHIENNRDNNCKSPDLELTIDANTTKISTCSDMNGFSLQTTTNIETSSPSQEKNLSYSNKREEINIATDIPLEHVHIKKETPSDSPLSNVDNVKSVIVINKAVVNNDKHILEDERTNELTMNMDTAQNTLLRTNNLNSVEIESETVSDNSKDSESQNKSISTTKKTPVSDGSRGRKRTRPRTPVEPDKDESSLPVRKRTRRRETELLQTIDEKRSPVEKNTDADFQAAHSLLFLKIKKERTDNQIDLTNNSLGNGELGNEDNEMN